MRNIHEENWDTLDKSSLETPYYGSPIDRRPVQLPSAECRMATCITPQLPLTSMLHSTAGVYHAAIHYHKDKEVYWSTESNPVYASIP